MEASYLKTIVDNDMSSRFGHTFTLVSKGKDKAKAVLFGGATGEALKKLDEDTLLSVFEGVPQFEIDKNDLNEIKIAELLTEKAAVFSSKGELRKMIQNGGVGINKEKISDFDLLVGKDMLLNEKYILVQKGKKNYFLLIAK